MLLALSIATVSGGQPHNVRDSFGLYDPAVQVFALSEANSAAYQLNLLQTGQVSSRLKPNLDLFEKYFPSLQKEEQLKLALLIVVNYEFDGEYGERFDLMTQGIRGEFAAWIQTLDHQRLREFVRRQHGEWKSFVDKCYAHFGVRL